MRFEGSFSQPYELNIDFTGSHYNFNTANKTVEIYVSNHYGNINLPMGTENALMNNPYTNDIFNGVVNVPDSVTNCWCMLQYLPNYNAPHTLGNNVNMCSAMFQGSENLNSRVTFPASGNGNLLSCSSMFTNCKSFNDLKIEKPYYVNSAQSMFYDCYVFNQPVTNLHAKNPYYMFGFCRKFNQPVNIPDHDASGDCRGMFYGCYEMNSPVTIGNNIVNCYEMFYLCGNMRQSVTMPDTVMNCGNMFNQCTKFNQPIHISDGVTNCKYMFRSCSSFNSPISWSPSGYVDCNGMFMGCRSFNQPITLPEYVFNCSSMFEDCVKLNQEITIPNTSNLYYIDGMFKRCTNQNMPIYVPSRFNHYGGGVSGWSSEANNCIVWY